MGGKVAQPPLFISTECPYLPVEFTIGPFQAQVSAYLATGFDGFLAIPESLGPRLPLPIRLQRLTLASGELILAPVYLGSFQIAGSPRRFPARIVLLGDEYLLGRRIIDRFAINFDHGLRVEVRE